MSSGEIVIAVVMWLSNLPKTKVCRSYDELEILMKCLPMLEMFVELATFRFLRQPLAKKIGSRVGNVN